MITGEKRKESTGESNYSKKIGLAQFEILGVNESNKKLKEEGFYVKEADIDEERTFTGDDDGVRTVRLEFALKQVTSMGTPYMKIASFWLKDMDRENETSGNMQWINDQGMTTWGSKATLPDWFKGAEGNLHPRKAKIGEEQFMKFMRSCMNINFKDGGVLKYDLNKLFNGNFKELKDDLKTDFLQTTIVACTIRSKDVKIEDSEETERKEYESFYPKAFAPGANIKFLNNKKEFKEVDIQAIKSKIDNNKGKKGKERTFIYPVEELVANMADQEYGCKDIFYTGLLKDFNPSESYISSNNTIDTESADY